MSCAIQTISENQTNMIDIPQFINKFEKLPDDIINKILWFAYPKLDIEFKKSIQVVSTHSKLELILNGWLRKKTPSNSPQSWYVIIKNTKQNMCELFHNLKNCGCCERHSQGVYYDNEGNNIKHFQGKINGSFTTKNLHNKTTLFGTKCTCSCRHHMRHIIRCFPVT